MVRLFVGLLVTCAVAFTQEGPDLSGYVPASKAIVAQVQPSRGELAGYLGVAVRTGDGGVVAEEVASGSPGDKAGIKSGDLIEKFAGQKVASAQSFREWVMSQKPGEPVKITLKRDGKTIELSATLSATSRPMKLSTSRAFLGADVSDMSEGPVLERVLPGSPAAEAGLRSGDRVISIDGKPFAKSDGFSDLVGSKKPGDSMTFAVRRDDGKEATIKVVLAEPRSRFGGPAAVWRKKSMKVAVIPVEFEDIKHNPKVEPAELEKHLFGEKRTGKDATEQVVYGSLADYFHEQSQGKFKLVGRAFAWVDVGKKRGDYIQGSGVSNKTQLLTDALDKLLARDGKSALQDFDTVCFVYAGERARTNPGAVYYPHSGTMAYQNKRLSYMIFPEGGGQLSPIGVFAKAAGQMLGLPDLAARTENIGSEGLGKWCALSDPFATPRPQHFGPWAHEKLGWLSPVVIDPTVKHKLILTPGECIKLLVRPDASEYYLVQNRKKQGFDADLPGEGLLIWRVVGDRPTLIESHGVIAPNGPTVHVANVPYPSVANAHFTPDTVPSSRSPLGGGLPVNVTNIRRLADGRVTLVLGHEIR